MSYVIQRQVSTGNWVQEKSFNKKGAVTRYLNANMPSSSPLRIKFPYGHGYLYLDANEWTTWRLNWRYDEEIYLDRVSKR